MVRGRPSYLPPRESGEGTYQDDPGTRYRISTIQPSTPESVIRNIWNEILQEVFTRREGFHIDQETGVLSGSQLRADLKVWRFYQESPRHFVDFLGLECKRGLNESASTAWRTATVQLIGYLQGFNSTRVWGAICMGKNVKFYEFFAARRGSRARLVELHEDHIRIDRQPQTVHYWLEYIRERAN